MAKKYNFTGPSLLFAAGVLAMALLVASDGGLLSEYLAKGESSAVEKTPEGPMMVDGRPVREAGPPTPSKSSTSTMSDWSDEELMVDASGYDPTPDDSADMERNFAPDGEAISELEESGDPQIAPPTGGPAAGPSGGMQIDESQIID